MKCTSTSSNIEDGHHNQERNYDFMPHDTTGVSNR